MHELLAEEAGGYLGLARRRGHTRERLTQSRVSTQANEDPNGSVVRAAPSVPRGDKRKPIDRTTNLPKGITYQPRPNGLEGKSAIFITSVTYKPEGGGPEARLQKYTRVARFGGDIEQAYTEALRLLNDMKANGAAYAAEQKSRPGNAKRQKKEVNGSKDGVKRAKN